MNDVKELLKQLAAGDAVKIPNEFYQQLLTQTIERDYLNGSSEMKFLDMKQRRVIHWLQINRLPVHPNENESYDLISRWQGVLSSLHAWGYRFYFLLLRYEGKTKLFLGVAPSVQDITSEEAVEQMREAAFGSMPGMDLRTLKGIDVLDEIVDPLGEMQAIGAVTGIPSFRKTEQKSTLQTLDQIAFGLRDTNGNEKNYAMLVIADPIHDGEISDIIARYRSLGSEIHKAVKTSNSYNISHNPNATRATGSTLLGTVIGTLGGAFLGEPMLGSMIGSQIASTMMANDNHQESEGVGIEYLDKFAEYAEAVTDHHAQRLNEGRNFGFWNTGVYVLGNSQRDVVTVCGMLRSVYSGEDTYFEPIRIHRFSPDSGALQIVRDRFDLLPLANTSLPGANNADFAKGEWHVFGKSYQYLSTPINTRELSLATSLPRRDVPGLRFVKTAVRFANNPAEVTRDKITLGNIVDMGVQQSNTYDIDVNSLVRHALVAGSTGSGKSTTCKRILKEVIRRDVPVMVVEPAKDDYVRWALKMNETLPPEKQFKIYMPGVKEFDGHPVQELKINPFEPGAPKGVHVDLMQHCEAFVTLLNACLPAEDVIPILIEETAYYSIQFKAFREGADIGAGEVKPLASYPLVDDMISDAKRIMSRKTYMQENRDNLTEVLNTRLQYLKRGTRGSVLNVPKSIDFDELFSGNVIINISRLAGTKDKSLVMSLLLQALYEYRTARYNTDAAYRGRAQNNELMHLMLIEEAHNVLLKPDPHQSSGSPQRAAADLFGTMLSEVRGYGQGMVVVDQVPTRLIDDATKNTNYKIVHRLVAPDDQELMAACMAFRDDQKYIIPALEKGNVIICGDEDDSAVWVKIPKD